MACIAAPRIRAGSESASVRKLDLNFNTASVGTLSDKDSLGDGIAITVSIGVATLGTLYLWLAEPGVLGIRNAFVVVMAVQVVIAIIASVYSRRLPDPRQGS